MKIKTILLAGILLAIITIGAVSAEDNLTASDDILSEDDTAIVADAEDAALADDEYITVNVSAESELVYGEYFDVEIQLSADTHGYVQYYFDEPDEYDEAQFLDDGESLWTQSSIRAFGDHTFFVKYLNGNRQDKTFSYQFSVTDYDIDIYQDDEYAYGDDYCLNIHIPSEAYGTLTVSVNDFNYTAVNDFGDEWVEEWPDYIMIKKDFIIYGENTVNLTYTPKNKESPFKAKTVEKSFNATGEIRSPYSVNYNEKANVTLILPNNATGKLKVQIADKNLTSDMKDGVATVEIPPLDVGYYEIFASFEGNYEIPNLDESIHVKPNVINPGIFWTEEPGQITVETSQSGKIDACVNGEVISTAEITDSKAVLSFTLPQGYHYISLVLNDDTFYEEEIQVITESPNWKINVTTDEVLKTYAYLRISNYPEYMKGENNFELEVDGVKVAILEESSSIVFNATNLSTGPHSYALNFKGDGYYRPTSTSGNFTIDYMILNCPDKIIIGDATGDDDCIYGYVPGDATGTVTVKVNGKKVYSDDFEGCGDDCQHFTIDATDLGIPLNTPLQAEVRFTDAKYGEVKRTVNIYLTYALRPESKVAYGNGEINIIAPHDLNVAKISLSIDGADYKVYEYPADEYTSYYYAKTTRDLAIGNHTAVMKYSGDTTYPAMTTTNTIAVYPEIYVDYGDGYATLALPDDAKGNLTGYANGVEFASVRPNEIIRFDMLSWGKYRLTFNYTADDYNISQYDDIFSMNPKITFKDKIIYGEQNSVSIDVGNASGSLDVQVDDYDWDAPLENGKASIVLPNLGVGKHQLYVTFYHTYLDSDGYEESDSYYYYPEITVTNPLKATDATVVYSANANYKAEIKDAYGNPVKSGSVTFYIIDGQKSILKKTVSIKNGVATLSYKITQAVKTYKIRTVYEKAEITKKITVKHAVSLKSATVKKSAKKLVLTATLSKINGKYLKNKKVTFKFNGKKYTAKTNKKGVAKVTIKKAVLSKLKVGKKVTYQATYLKDTVKKTVKVKK